MAQLVEDDLPFTDVAVESVEIQNYESGVFFFLATLLFSIPVVCFVGALFTDISYVNDADIQWSNFSTWLLAAGIFFLGIAIAVYAVAYLLTRDRPRTGLSWIFGLVLIAAFITGLFDNFIHSHDGWTAVWPTGITLTIVTVILLVVAVAIKVASLSNRYMVTES